MRRTEEKSASVAGGRNFASRGIMGPHEVTPCTPRYSSAVVLEGCQGTPHGAERGKYLAVDVPICEAVA